MISGMANGRPSHKLRRGLTLKLFLAPTGYYRVNLCAEGKVTGHVVQRLVCAAFHGAAPSGGHHAAHWDGNRTNNRPENLRWATAIENAADQKRHGTKVPPRKITETEARAIIDRLNSGEAQKAIARSIGYSRGMVQNIALRRSWTHLSHLLAA